MVETQTWYPITWLGIRGDKYCLDCADRVQAERIAVALAEIGRKLVQLHSGYEIAPDMETVERIRARVKATLYGAPVEAVMRELAG